jgi:hypothetical protein
MHGVREAVILALQTPEGKIHAHDIAKHLLASLTVKNTNVSWPDPGKGREGKTPKR